MSDLVSQILRDWQNFYLLTGTAAATLIGLQFIAASLGTGLVTSSTKLLISTWVTPTIIHFGTVLVIAVVSTIPVLNALLLAVLLGIGGLAGLGYTSAVGIGMWRQGRKTPLASSVWIWYVVAPLLSYGILPGIAVGLLLNNQQVVNLLALPIILLLILGIRNAWDLTVWIKQNRRE